MVDVIRVRGGDVRVDGGGTSPNNELFVLVQTASKQLVSLLFLRTSLFDHI